MPKGKLRRGSKSVNYRSARDIDAEELHRDIAEDFVALIEPRNENEFLHALENVNSPIYKRLQVLLFEMGVEADIARVCEEIAAYVALEKEKQKQQFLEDLRAEEVKKQKEIQIQNALIKEQEQLRLAQIRELNSVEKIQEAINYLTKQNTAIQDQIRHLTNQLSNLAPIHNQINQQWQQQQNAHVAAVMQKLAAAPLMTPAGVPMILDPNDENAKAALGSPSPVDLLKKVPHIMENVTTPEAVEEKSAVLVGTMAIHQHIRMLAMIGKHEHPQSLDDSIDPTHTGKLILDANKLNPDLGKQIMENMPPALKQLINKAMTSNPEYLKAKIEQLEKQKEQNAVAIEFYVDKLNKLVAKDRPRPAM